MNMVTWSRDVHTHEHAIAHGSCCFVLLSVVTAVCSVNHIEAICLKTGAIKWLRKHKIIIAKFPKCGNITVAMHVSAYLG